MVVSQAASKFGTNRQHRHRRIDGPQFYSEDASPCCLRAPQRARGFVVAVRGGCNGRFKQTKLQQDIVSLKFVRPDVAVVEVLTSVTGVVAAQLAPGTSGDTTGRLRTRLLQVVVKQGEEWKVVAYHNVDVKPGIPLPEPR